MEHNRAQVQRIRAINHPIKRNYSNWLLMIIISSAVYGWLCFRSFQMSLHPDKSVRNCFMLAIFACCIFNVCILCIINHSARYVSRARATRNSDRYGRRLRPMSTNVLAIVQPANAYMTLRLIISPNDFPWYTMYSVPSSKRFSLALNFEYIKPLSLYRLWGSNSWCRNYFSPLCLCRLLQIIGHSNFRLVLHNVANSTQNSATIIYFGFIFKVNTQILYTSQRIWMYIVCVSMSTFCSNKMCTNLSNVIEADVNSSRNGRDTSLLVNGSLLLHSLCIFVMFIFILLRSAHTLYLFGEREKRNELKGTIYSNDDEISFQETQCEFLPNAWNFLFSFHWATLARSMNIGNIQISCE